jgi:enoyl-CoA hydratase/carnithine racemase
MSEETRRDTVTVRPFDGWTEIRIDREAKRNALDRRTRLLLREALEAARGARAVVLTGTGGSFCSGLDLKERAAEVAAGQADTAGDEAIALNMALRQHPAVVIAAVNGLAYGGGVTLVNSCDLALAASTATLACPEISFASYASMAGPTSSLLLTRKRAAWLLLANERLDAATAERWGLVNEVVAPDGLAARAAELATRIAGYDAATLDETKKALNRLPAATDTGAWRAALEYGQTVNEAIRARKRAAA